MNCSYFYYDRLPNEQSRAIYRQIRKTFDSGDYRSRFAFKVKDPAHAKEDASAALQALVDDRPNFFFIGSASRVIIQADRLQILLRINYRPGTIHSLQQLLSMRLDGMVSKAKLHASSVWDIEKSIYTQIAQNYTYGKPNDSTDYNNLVGMLLDRRGVCCAFAALLCLALRRAGIPCITVLGKAKGSSGFHRWNIAWLNNEPVHLDVTWDLPPNGGHMFYRYFNLSCRQIQRDHKLYEKNMPCCDSESYTFYAQKHLEYATGAEAQRYLLHALQHDNTVRFRLTGRGSAEGCIAKALPLAPPGSYTYCCDEALKTGMVIRNSA